MCASLCAELAEAPERVRQQRDQAERDVSVDDGETVREMWRQKEEEMMKKCDTATRERRNVN